MIVQAIHKINPEAQIVVRGNDLDTCTIEWHHGTPEISKDEIRLKMIEVQAESDALKYARKREVEYPRLTDFAEAYCEKEFGGDSTKMDSYKIKYNKVRTENPKS